MKKLFVILFAVATLSACGKIDNVVNKVESSFGMLERTVTLYANDGKVIKSWKTKNEIVYGGPVAGFVDVDGNNVRVSGTFIVEGK